MPRHAVAALTACTFALSLAGPAAAESLSFAQRLAIYRACKPDLDRNCPSAGTDATRIRTCLTTHQRNLSDGCRTTIRATGAR